MKCSTCSTKYCEDCGKKIEPVSTQDREDYWRVDVDGSKSTQDIYNECEKLFPCWKYTDVLDPTDDRIMSYTVYFKKNVEADEEYKNMSANDLKEKRMQCITLKERLLLEIMYFKETGKHLDIDSVTLCAGSRYADGGVPRVGFDDDEVFVRWYDVDDRDDDLRARSSFL